MRKRSPDFGNSNAIGLHRHEPHCHRVIKFAKGTLSRLPNRLLFQLIVIGQLSTLPRWSRKEQSAELSHLWRGGLRVPPDYTNLIILCLLSGVTSSFTV